MVQEEEAGLPANFFFLLVVSFSSVESAERCRCTRNNIHQTPDLGHITWCARERQHHRSFALPCSTQRAE